MSEEKYSLEKPSDQFNENNTLDLATENNSNEGNNLIQSEENKSEVSIEYEEKIKTLEDKCSELMKIKSYLEGQLEIVSKYSSLREKKSKYIF